MIQYDLFALEKFHPSLQSAYPFNFSFMNNNTFFSSFSNFSVGVNNLTVDVLD